MPLRPKGQTKRRARHRYELTHAAAARIAAGLDGMLALRQEHKFSGDDIAEMTLGIPRIIQSRLTNPHPVDLQAAQMCLPFDVALASKLPLAPNTVPTVNVSDFEAGLADRSLYEIEVRTIVLDDEVEAASDELSTAARVSVTLRDGRKLSKSRRRKAVRRGLSRARSTERVLSMNRERPRPETTTKNLPENRDGILRH
jgi:2-methylcitrate dehydratase PrpD